MDRLEPCLAGDGGGDCIALSSEVRDIAAYHGLLTSILEGHSPAKNATASAALVTLHNLVTDTVAVEYQIGRWRYFCANDVIATLPREFVADAGPVGPVPRLNGLPGLGLHLDVRC